MLTRREILERNCQLELNYIAKAIDWEKFFGTSSTHEDKMETLVNSILKGFAGGRGATAKEVFRDENTVSLRETTFYKLAQILQTDYVTDWNKFKEEVRRKIPTYKKNPKGALALLSLPWMLKFDIPVVKKRPGMSATYRRKRGLGPLPPKPGVREIPAEFMLDKKPLEEATKEPKPEWRTEALEHSVVGLQNEIADLKERLNELTDFVLTEVLGFDKYERVKKLIRG